MGVTLVKIKKNILVLNLGEHGVEQQHQVQDIQIITMLSESSRSGGRANHKTNPLRMRRNLGEDVDLSIIHEIEILSNPI